MHPFLFTFLIILKRVSSLYYIVSGQELTYKGHAGLGRPIPAPFCSTGGRSSYSRPGPAVPKAMPSPMGPLPSSTRPLPSYLFSSRDTTDQELIQPKKVRGTPTMYADLQFPTSSNFGSMKRKNWRERRAGGEADTAAEYARIKFNPSFAERAEL